MYKYTWLWIATLVVLIKYAYAYVILQIVVLEKTLESPLDCKEIKPVNPKGN